MSHIKLLNKNLEDNYCLLCSNPLAFYNLIWCPIEQFKFQMVDLRDSVKFKKNVIYKIKVLTIAHTTYNTMLTLEYPLRASLLGFEQTWVTHIP